MKRGVCLIIVLACFWASCDDDMPFLQTGGPEPPPYCMDYIMEVINNTGSDVTLSIAGF